VPLGRRSGDPLTRPTLPPTALTAAEELQRRVERFEVFTRNGLTTALSRDPRGRWTQRTSREIGVACRVSDRGRRGFAAASGSGARAGREAALAAAAGMTPGADPLPPAALLGTTPVPPFGAKVTAPELWTFARALEARVAHNRHGISLVQARLLHGEATAHLVTGEGFSAEMLSQGVIAELLLAPPHGPWRLHHTAATNLETLSPARIASQAIEHARCAMQGAALARCLADVVLGPSAAAALVAGLARSLSRPGAHPSGPRPRISRAWRLTDERAGPRGLVPSGWDGEGLPARVITLLADGQCPERPCTFAQAHREGCQPGGAVRLSYSHPPVAGPANLVVDGSPRHPTAELLGRLGDGFYLPFAAGPLRADPGSGRFALRVAAVRIVDGRPTESFPLVDLRGSFRRVLGALEAVGDDPSSFSLACAVTTPALLLRRLELA
jgi:predicted Zn-dependent protease